MRLKKLFTILFLLTFDVYLLSAQGVEVKIDKFYTGLLLRLKQVKAEKDDEKAIALMKKIKEDMTTSADQLNIELEDYLNTLSEEQLIAWDEKVKEKKYNKEIFDLTFDPVFIQRINTNPEFEQAYYEIIDLSDRILEIEFAEPVDPLSECRFTLDGGKFHNQSFVMDPSAMKDASAFVDEGELTFNIEGYLNDQLVGISFLIGDEKTGTYHWKDEYNFTLTLSDNDQEVIYGGHEGKGDIIVETLEPLGGWITGKFEGTLISDDQSKNSVQIKGAFKVRRIIEME